MQTARCLSVAQGLALAILLPAVGQASSRSEDRDYLMELAKSTNIHSRVNGGNILWKTFPEDRPFVLKLMKNDPSPDVRMRLALIVVQNGGHPSANKVLEKILDKADVRTHHGAERALLAAGGLSLATGKRVDIEIVTAILTAPTTWFADARSSKHSHSLVGTLQLLAAGRLLDHAKKNPNLDFEKPLSRLFQDVEGALKTGNSKKKKFWKTRLPGLFEMVGRANKKDFLKRHAHLVDFLEDKRGIERIRRVLAPGNKSNK